MWDHVHMHSQQPLEPGMVVFIHQFRLRVLEERDKVYSIRWHDYYI